MRAWWLAVGVFAVAGCQTILAPVPRPDVIPASATLETDDPLTLAAECLKAGNDSAACTHLEAHVRAHPEQVMFRAHLAELLVKLGKDVEARRHFERFVADARTATGPVRAHLVHCHTRLMEIAGRADDRPAELYHRGVGLLLLVKEQDRDPAARDEEFCEEVLCKAMAALREAKELRPADARVRLALADVYERTGNRRAAEVERAAARNTAEPLPPCEHRATAY
jgi:Tfp pilus assembly protein PilF